MISFPSPFTGGRIRKIRAVRIRRDGTSNPDNFDDHRRALMRFSVQAPALAATWHLTGAGNRNHRQIHLVEVAQAVPFVRDSGGLSKER